jgi:hypothetical protein
MRADSLRERLGALRTSGWSFAHLMSSFTSG